MILQALKEYYDRKAADPSSDIAPEGWERKEIPFLIVIDKDGNFIQFEDTREGEGKKKRGKVFLVPQAVKKTSGIAANLLWDVAGYVLGVDNKGKPERALLQRSAFLKQIESELGHVSDVQPILSFLRQIDFSCFEKDPLWQEILDTNPNLTFRILGEPQLIFHCPDISDVISRREEKNIFGICMITGESDEIATLHTAIKGVYGAQSSGANIVSFNLDAFRSYGKEQGGNAPIGTRSVFAYSTAINTLLSRDSEQRMSIGDSTVIFWSEKQTDFESDFSLFFSEPPKDDPDAGTRAIQSMYEAIRNGFYHNDDIAIRFHILGLAPNAARISIRFWEVGTISDFSTRIRTHFEDIAIVKPPKDPEYYSLWRLLVNTAAQDKSENITPNLAGDFMRSILNGTPYPASLLQAVLRRIHSDVENRVKPVRAALIKGYLNRYYRVYPSPQHKEIQMTLDTSQPSVGYQLGRLFAVLEKIQEEANPGLNSTIRERFYGSACASPVTVFSNLMRLKNHHLAKMDNKGRVVNLERLLSEIVSHIEDFPAHLNLHEQGRFAIGYYHQRQDFFTSKKDTHNDAEQA